MNRSMRRRAEKISVNAAPSAAEQLFGQAVRHLAAGADAQAIAAYQQALAMQPGHADAYYGLGLAQHRLGRLEAASDSYRTAIARDPRHALAFNNLALLCQQLGRLEEAEASAMKAFALDPASPMILGNLAAVRMARGDLDRAVESLQRALAIEPDNVSWLTSLGAALCRQGRIAEAIAAGRRAVTLQPGLALAQHNLAAELLQSGEWEESLIRFRSALAIDPDRAETHKALGIALLAHGDFAAGWDEFEWRWRVKDEAAILASGLAALPRWAGEALSDQTLLIPAEQGLGDTIQFVRYVPLVLARATRVILWVQPALKALLSSIDGVTVLGMDEPVDGVGVYCPLISLPRLFQTTAQTIPPVVPYVRTDPAAVESWRTRIGRDDRLKVGICWQGKSGVDIDRGRSIPLSFFAPLARMPSVRLISLQKNVGTEQLADLPKGMKVETLGETFDAGAGAFLDTAAVMESLDLVITSDTAVAHIAGTLRRPTWVALKRYPDWRWGTEATQSPWYPSMRLFRQTTPGDWGGVFDEIAGALTALAGGRRVG